MPYSKVNWAYKDAITTQKQGQMSENPSWVFEHGIYGGKISITGTSTIEVSPTKLSLEGQWIREDTTANLVLTAENNAHWREGTSQENATGSAQAFFIYAYNSASSVAVKFSASGPAYSDTLSATSNGTKMYDKSGSTWFRLLGAVYNNTAGLFNQYQRGKWVFYDNDAGDTDFILVNAETTGTFTDVDVSLVMPIFTQMGLFHYRHGGHDCMPRIRPNGSTSSGGHMLVGAIAGAGATNTFHFPTDENQVVEIMVNGVTPVFNRLKLLGYYIGGIR